MAASHPDQVARRMVDLTYVASAGQALGIKEALMHSGLFESVQIQTAVRSTLSANTDELTNYTGDSDIHHRQWDFNQLNMEPALSVTKGPALISSLDGGLNPNHPDINDNLRGQWSAQDKHDDDLTALTPIAFSRLGFDSNGLNGPDAVTAHGMHTSGIMAAELNSGTTPMSGTGIVGICPKCAFATDKILQSASTGTLGTATIARAFDLYGQRIGATAINYSGHLEPAAPVVASIAQAAIRDVVLVASAGNNASSVAFGIDFPANDPNVYGIGGTDSTGRTWSEYRIYTDDTNYPWSKRHPGIGRGQVVGVVNANNSLIFAGRCGNASKNEVLLNREECGTNAGPQIAFMAPAAQVISTLDRSYIKQGYTYASGNSCIPTASDPQPPFPLIFNCIHTPPFGNALGSSGATSNGVLIVGQYAVNSPLPPAFNNWGVGTGTSMAAPHITGLVGLIRSINPLLSTKISSDPRSGGEIGEALSAGATAVVSDPSDPLGCVRGCGAGIPNAFNALNKAAGTIANVQLNNRLTPMFQLRSDAAAKLDKSEASLAVAEAWLNTTSAQVAMAALNGTLYYTGDMDAPVSGNVFDFGVNSMLAYKAGFENGTSTTHAIPASQYRHKMWGTSDQSTTLPFASFYVFSTENAPANTTLLPLYRMSSKCYGLRKHFYTTNDTTRNQYAAGPGQASFGTSLTGCITGPNASDRGYFYDGVEGYIFSTQQPGTIALNSGYKTATGTANSGWALFTADEASRFTDYNAGVSILGYVYPAVAWNGGVATYNDFDSDGLSDSYELAMGLNEQAANSDCDAVNDGVEFPMAGLSNSDPLISENCADRRIRIHFDGSTNQVKLEMRNAGPNAVSNITFYFRAASQLTIGTLNLPNGCTIAPWKITYPVPGPGPYKAYRCVFAAMPVGTSAVISFDATGMPYPGQAATYWGEVEIAGTPISDPAPVNDVQTFVY